MECDFFMLKIHGFFKRNIKELIDGKFHYSILIQKIRALLIYMAILLFLPIVLVARSLRPLVHIRFGKLRSSRIGHFAGNTELYLCRRDAGMYKGTFDLFFCDRPVANQQLKKMFGRILPVFEFFSILYRVNRLLPGYKNHEVPLNQAKDLDDLLINTNPHVSFTAEEKNLGVKALKDMGMPEGAPFICFHSRDPAYLNKMLPGTDWSYWNFRDSSIYSYIPAAELLVSRGYFAIRIGAVVKEKLNNNNQKIIDYAVKYRSDFLDIYLLANCKFLIGSMSGLTNVSYELFRKPIVWVNVTPFIIMHFWCASSLFIPKKLWCKKRHRFLKFSEMVADSFPPKLKRTELFEKNSLEVIDNSSEEITALTIEMDNRLQGTWEATEEDEELQKKFRDIILKSKYPGKIRARIGAEFLRQNKDLLD